MDAVSSASKPSFLQKRLNLKNTSFKNSMNDVTLRLQNLQVLDLKPACDAKNQKQKVPDDPSSLSSSDDQSPVMEANKSITNNGRLNKMKSTLLPYLKATPTDF